MMKTTHPTRLVAVTVLLGLELVPLHAAAPQAPGTAFAYQGYFTDSGKPADGLYDLSFRLLGDQYEVVAGGGPMWSNTDFLRPAAGWTVEDVMVKDGQFQVDIDFGPAVVYDGSVRFLEVAVRAGASAGEFRILVPPHRLVPVPKALHANAAGAVTGLLSISNLPPSVARLDLPQVFVARPAFLPPSGAPFVVGLTDTVQQLSADLLDGLDSSAFWRRDVKDGASGIVEPQDLPVEIRVQNTRVLRLQEGDSNLGWSVVGGSAGNTVAPGVPGAVVGGGRGNLIETGAHYSSLLGGDGNKIDQNARDSVIGGGTGQIIGPNSINAGVFAGYDNEVGSNSRFAGVLLGSNGKVRENSDFSAVLSGGDNTIGPATYSVILGGGANRIESGANVSLIASGQQNTISTQAFASAIVAGQLNKIHPGGRRAFVGGGDYNEIGPESYNAFLGGGGRNQIQFNAPYSAILGGNLNLVRSNAGWATVLGGVQSVAGAPFAIAAGHQARAEHPGSIVLTDGQYADFESKAANEFAVRAAGGVRFETGGKGLTVDGTNLFEAIIHGDTWSAQLTTERIANLAVTTPKIADGAISATKLAAGAARERLLAEDGPGSGIDADRLDGLSSEEFWRLNGNAGTTAANYVGTTDDQPLQLRVNSAVGLRLVPDDPFQGLVLHSPNLIGGSAFNAIAEGNGGSVVGGGGTPALLTVGVPGIGQVPLNGGNVISASFATVAGGAGNTVRAPGAAIGGGARNLIEDDAALAVIGGGQGHEVHTNAAFATVSGGRSNEVAGFSLLGTVGGGWGNRVAATLGTIPGGRAAVAASYGQQAYASGSFEAPGDAQGSLFVLRGVTSNTVPTEIFLDGTGRRMTLSRNAAWTFEMMTVARSEAGTVAGYRQAGVVWNRDGQLFMSPAPTETLFEPPAVAGWDAEATISMLNDVFQVKVTGSSGETVRWVATVRTAEVVF